MRFTITLVLIIVLISLASASVEYTPTTEKSCNGGKCTLIAYSNPHYVLEDGEWKQFSKARSLLGKGWEVVYIENDKDYVVEVIDFNFTSVTLNLNPDGIVFLDKEVPLKTWSYDETKSSDEKVGDFKLDYKKETDTLVDFSIFKQSETVTLDTELGDIIEFGPNSTTITLQTPDSQNLGDSYVDSASGGTNFGTETSISIIQADGAARNFSGIIGFNTSAVPVGVTIDSVNITFGMSTNNLDAGESFNTSFNWVYSNYSWNETTVTYNNRPRETLNYSTADLTYFRWNSTNAPNLGNTTINVTAQFINSYNAGEKNFTLYIIPFDETGSPNTADDINLHSKQSIQAGGVYRPKLAITYSTPVSSTCNYTSGNYVVDCSLNCTITQNVALGGVNNFTLNGTGYFKLDGANITSYKVAKVFGNSPSQTCRLISINGGGLRQ